MFFKKETKILEDSVAPVYVIGGSALGCYLAARLVDAGETPVIIADKDSNIYLNTNGIILKDDLSLTKKNYRFATSPFMTAKPKFTLIAAENHRLKSLLTTLSPSKIQDTPVILFSYLKDIKHIKSWIGKNLYQAFFDGYLSKSDQTVSIYGRNPGIVMLSKNKEELEETLAPLGIPVAFTEDKKTAFWKHFAGYALGSTLSAALNKSIFDIIKENQCKGLIQTLCGEMATLATKEHAEVREEEILKEIYQIPHDYIFPLQKTVKAKKVCDVDLIASQILNTARKHKAKIPETQKLLKQIYHIILA